MLVCDMYEHIVLNLNNASCIRVMLLDEGIPVINFVFPSYGSKNIYFPDLDSACNCLEDMMLCFKSGSQIYFVSKFLSLSSEEESDEKEHS